MIAWECVPVRTEASVVHIDLWLSVGPFEEFCRAVCRPLFDWVALWALWLADSGNKCFSNESLHCVLSARFARYIRFRIAGSRCHGMDCVDNGRFISMSFGGIRLKFIIGKLAQWVKREMQRCERINGAFNIRNAASVPKLGSRMICVRKDCIFYARGGPPDYVFPPN